MTPNTTPNRFAILITHGTDTLAWTHAAVRYAVKSMMEVTEKWRHSHVNLGAINEKRRRHNAPDTIEAGNFCYEKILHLLKSVEEEEQY